MNCKCGCEVVDGVNGVVSPPPPWDEGGDSTAYCYQCENLEMLEAGLAEVERSVEAAQRAGRFDLV